MKLLYIIIPFILTFSTVSIAGQTGGGATPPVQTVDKIIGSLDSTEILSGADQPDVSFPVSDIDFQELVKASLSSRSRTPVSWKTTTRDGEDLTVSPDSYDFKTGTLNVNTENGLIRLRSKPRASDLLLKSMLLATPEQN
ncbi:MAG: hypothetical protein EOP04_07955 [Proteobacteria bacterium]|nr:MAG: hypothetical protein EOP04_07955 [Pseudomonadota bacterium]